MKKLLLSLFLVSSSYIAAVIEDTPCKKKCESFLSECNLDCDIVGEYAGKGKLGDCKNECCEKTFQNFVTDCKKLCDRSITCIEKQ
ncbi:MAG TPA: hypothetical protein VJ201_07590 [Candidatus Babeliales bacterium]|nr:hypothetical protein [Candidatus Babeliales bacterium]